MKPIYNQAQLAEMAKERFETLGVDKLFATSDGQFFLLENRAQLHAGPKGMVHELKKGGSKSKGADTGAATISISVLETMVKSENDLQKLTDMLLAEVGADNREEAKNIIQARIDSLTDDGKQAEKATQERDGIIAELTAQGKDFDPNADTAELKALLEGGEADTTDAVQPLDLTGNVGNTGKLIAKCKDVAVLNATKAAEQAGQNRKGVMTAIAARIEELEK